MSLIEYFTDPILRAPTLGSILMCLASSLVGVIVFIQRRSLIGEALSHASYPGVVIGAVIAASSSLISEQFMAFSVLLSAFFGALIAMLCIEFLQKRLSLKDDVSLCFVLSCFFGLGVLLASRVQFTHPVWHQKIHVFLYGQAATLDDFHVLFYLVLSCICIGFIYLFYRLIQVVNFDRNYALSIGIPVSMIQTLFNFLLILAIVIGMRSVGLVLMSGMLIAPAVAARQLTHKLSLFFVFSALIGMSSAFFGNVLSVSIPQWLDLHFSLPTGPMILLTASSIAFTLLFFAPKKGLFVRYLRMLRFQNQCRLENILKGFCRSGECIITSFAHIRKAQGIPSLYLRWLLFRLEAQGWLVKKQNNYQLTSAGVQKALAIIRLHRLWEVYLVDYLGRGIEEVHSNAEKIEHIITPELEKELTLLLNNPEHDPHQKPIPPQEGVLI